jgi:hypothetical protein
MVDQTLHKGLHKGQARIKFGETYFQRTKDRQVVWAIKYLDMALRTSPVRVQKTAGAQGAPFGILFSYW